MPKVADTGDPRAEQVFFDDPAIDRMLAMLMSLATEHFVLSDRVRALEAELTKRGPLPAGVLDAAPAAEDAEVARRRAAVFAHTLLEPLLGRAGSAGAGGRHSLAPKRRTRR